MPQPTTIDSNVEKTEKESQDTSNVKTCDKMKPTPFMFGTPIFFNNMPRYYFNNLYKKKSKPLTEREGDWICHNCKNLNFAFRVECNRCKLEKGADSKSEANINEDSKENNKDEQKAYTRNQKYN